jgi:hypothetical protein
MSSLLALTDDEIALLRFTCDLFFVAESPLWAFEAEPREPADYDGSYRALVDRGVVDPHGFRITDDALNRIAPVTECDARIIHLEYDDDGNVTQDDHWLLDEIAVVYEVHEAPTGGRRHVFGADLDAEALVARLGRRMQPRRAGGDRFDATLTPAEVLAVSLLLSTSAARARQPVADDAVRTALARIPPDESVLPAAGVHAVSLLAMTKQKEPRSVDAIVRSLVDKRVLHRTVGGLRIDGALAALQGFGARRRHTIVRTDFRDDDWLVREVTLLPVDGSLFVVAPARGGFRVTELDGDALRDTLYAAIAPQVPGARPHEQPRFASLLAGTRR